MPLQEFVQATADATGRATSVKGPARYGETWQITSVNTTTNSVAETQLRVFRGVESESAQVLTTYSGNSDTAGGGDPIVLGAGDKLVFVWSGADVGAICTARLEGTFVSGRR